MVINVLFYRQVNNWPDFNTSTRVQSNAALTSEVNVKKSTALTATCAICALDYAHNVSAAETISVLPL